MVAEQVSTGGLDGVEVRDAVAVEVGCRAGRREQAMRRIVDSLGDVSDLPAAGRFEVSRVIDGENVTIRGVVVNGIPRIGTAFNPVSSLEEI
ncbi:hypothetical protein [Streptomyces aidingensis]|uniref:hypothetical protein n=1 Tax=Streptomyces aidingensis TaxID=910347 RepID=UPI001114CE22|nr:hypothetical protein [Streptomyces aidingensis]